jgi:hypothetical protein
MAYAIVEHWATPLPAGTQVPDCELPRLPSRTCRLPTSAGDRRSSPSTSKTEATSAPTRSGLDPFVFRPRGDPVAQIERFGRADAPGVREAARTA